MPPQSELELMLTWDEPESVMESFIQYVANGGLTRYKHIIQWGGKEGEPLYSHVVNGVCNAETLRDVLKLADDEARVLFCAYAIHDLNKALDSEGKSFNRLATLEAIQAESENVGVPGFFPAYQEYLEDIAALIRGHSGHFHTNAEFLIPAHNPYRLPRERLEMLRDLMRALDDLDLSHTLEERDHKTGFLKLLNAHTDQQYEFAYHQVSEQRGLITNIIHNQVKAYLAEYKTLIPLLLYPEGVVYLAERGQGITINDADLAIMGQNVARAAARMTRGSFEKFIKAGIHGIKVNKQCLSLKLPFADIFSVVDKQVRNKIVGKRFKIEGPEGVEQKCRDELQAALADETLATTHPSVQHYLTQPTLCPPTQSGMGVGELLRSYYIFLNDHYAKQLDDVWAHLYRWLNLPPEKTQLYDLFSPRLRRAYVVANDLGLSLEALLEKIIEDGKQVVGETDNGTTESVGDFAALGDYLKHAITFSWPGARPTNFAATLQQYVTNNHKQCSLCGSEFPTDKLMSPEVPANITVQSFSNRLPGGWGSEPKRNVCALCRTQFILDKLNRVAGKNIKTLYLHLSPHSFFTEPFIRSLRAEVGEIMQDETSVLFLKTDDAVRAMLQAEAAPFKLSFYTRNKQGKPYTNGMALPINYSEAISNILTFPLNCPGDNDSEQFLFALQNALLIGRYFACKVQLTESPVPILGKSDFGSLFVDNIPFGFHGLLPENDFGYEALESLWQDYKQLFQLKGLLYNASSEQDALLPLIQSLTSEGRLALYWTADRLLEKKSDGGWGAIRLAQECLPFIKTLVKGDAHMKALQTLAEMAWRDRIIGRTIENRNSLIKPFNMLLEGLEAKSEAFGIDTLRAQMAEEIFRHIEAIASDEYKPGRTKREKVKAFVDTFFDGVLNDVYRGSVTKLLSDTKALRSAYLFYIREQIPLKSKEAK